jgi:hypothetical protein
MAKNLPPGDLHLIIEKLKKAVKIKFEIDKKPVHPT